MDDATFYPPDLTTFCRLDDLGMVVVGQHVTSRRTVLECRVVPVPGDEFCRMCGARGILRGTVTHRLAHELFGWRPTTLLLWVRRFRCPAYKQVWRQDMSKAAQPRAKLSRAAPRWPGR